MRSIPRILFCVLILAALAPTGARGAEVVREVIEVPTRDGDTMRVETVRDASLDPQPVLLTLSPYNQGADPMGNADRTDSLAARYLSRGIARAFGDVLGTRGSSGCWDYGGNVERRASVDVVNHLAALPWSNGRVGMIGVSYDGTTPFQVAISGEEAPGLAAVVPIAGVASWYDYDYSRGSRNFSGWGVSANFDTEYSRMLPPPRPNGPNRDAVVDGLMPCDIVDHTARSYSDSPRHDAWWAERDYRLGAGNVRVPIAVVHGWTDENVQTRHSISFWEALEASTSTAPRFLFLHPGGHTWPSGDRWFAFLDRFLTETLLEAVPDLSDVPRVWSTSAGLPLPTESTAWPPPQAAPLTYHLAPGMLAEEPQDAAPASFTALATGNRSLRYETGFLLGGRIAGTVTADLALTVDSRREQFVAELFEVGTNQRITTSYLDLRYVHGLEEPVDLVPGAPLDVRISFQPRDHVLRPGARLRLVLSAYDGGQLYPPRGSVVTVHHGAGGRASTLTLPFIAP